MYSNTHTQQTPLSRLYEPSEATQDTTTRVRIAVLVCAVIVMIFGTLFFVAPQNVSAQEVVPYTPLAPLPGTTNPDGTVTPNNYLIGLYRLGLFSAGILAVVMIMIGGFQYMASDAVSSKESGKSRIQAAVLGLVLLLASVLILQTINPDLVKFGFGPTRVGVTSEAPPGDVESAPDIPRWYCPSYTSKVCTSRIVEKNPGGCFPSEDACKTALESPPKDSNIWYCLVPKKNKCTTLTTATEPTGFSFCSNDLATCEKKVEP